MIAGASCGSCIQLSYKEVHENEEAEELKGVGSVAQGELLPTQNMNLY